jgi:outer membrane protein
MKNLMLTFLLGFILLIPGFAQKYAYVDTEYILDNIPEYKDAQIQLDDLAAEYQQEIEEKFGEINKMYKNFQAEAVLMPDDVKKKKEEEIQAKEKEVKDLQKQRFGPDGDLFLKREELVKPIQEKIYNAIEEIAMDDNYAFVFDRAGSLTILYVNARFDISDDVLDKVGAELGTVRREDRVKKEYTPTGSGDNNRGTAPPRGPGGNSPGPVKGKDRK